MAETRPYNRREVSAHVEAAFDRKKRSAQGMLKHLIRRFAPPSSAHNSPLPSLSFGMLLCRPANASHRASDSLYRSLREYARRSSGYHHDSRTTASQLGESAYQRCCEDVSKCLVSLSRLATATASPKNINNRVLVDPSFPSVFTL
jgi:hypothetical protein